MQQAMGELQRSLQYTNFRLAVVGQKIAALEAAEALRETGRKPRMPLEFRAQIGEDVLIWDMLGRQTEGFFIEVGAFDGYSFSVTYALEAIGWSGLLVEAIPERAAECRKRRPGSRVEHAAISRPGAGSTATFHVAADELGGMRSFLHTTAVNISSMDEAGVQRRPVTVPLTTMNDLLKSHSGPIDAAVIDVEGGEVALLEGFDLKKYRPRLMLIEDAMMGRDPALAKYMSTQPYTQVGWLEFNRIYVHNEAKDIMQRNRRF